MPEKRPDLDGRRLREPGRADVWLVFGGERHRILGDATAHRLFRDPENVEVMDDILSIALGSPITPDAVLVQSESNSAMFLLTGSPAAKIAKYYVTSWESFLDFGFRRDTVVPLPSIAIDGLRAGYELQSAADRARRAEEFKNKPKN